MQAPAGLSQRRRRLPNKTNHLQPGRRRCFYLAIPPFHLCLGLRSYSRFRLGTHACAKVRGPLSLGGSRRDGREKIMRGLFRSREGVRYWAGRSHFVQLLSRRAGRLQDAGRNIPGL